MFFITKGSIYHIRHNAYTTIYLLPWEWIDLKLDVKFKYLLCLIFAHTVFLLCTADLTEFDLWKKTNNIKW